MQTWFSSYKNFSSFLSYGLFLFSNFGIMSKAHFGENVLFLVYILRRRVVEMKRLD